MAAVGRRFALRADEPLEGRRVLLVDDLVVTGWTLTLAARAVRRAGAAEVRPLVLDQLIPAVEPAWPPQSAR